jgi:hypothetical protein
VARLGSLWSGLSWRSRVLLVLSVLASAAVTVILAIVLYLFLGGYSLTRRQPPVDPNRKGGQRR